MNYDDNNPIHRKQLNDWLTRPRNNLNRIVYDGSKPEHKPVDPFDNIMKKSAVVDDNKGAQKYLNNKKLYSDKTEQALRKHLIADLTAGKQLDSDQIRFLLDSKPTEPKYPKEASPEQVKTLETKLKKYRAIHGEPKPFVKPKKVISENSKKIAAEVVKPLMPEPKSEKPVVIEKEPFDIYKHIKEKADEKLKKEIEEHEKMFGRGGIADLGRPV